MWPARSIKLPVIAANRIGDENGQKFYGHSFIADEWGDLVAEYGAAEAGVLVTRLDLSRAAAQAQVKKAVVN